MFKRCTKAFPVQGKIPDIMFAVSRLRGATAYKNGFGLKFSGLNGMGLKKGNGEEGYLMQGIYLVDVDMQGITIFPVEFVVCMLETEQFNGQVDEVALRSCEDASFQVIIFNGFFQFQSLNLTFNTQRCGTLL